MKLFPVVFSPSWLCSHFKGIVPGVSTTQYIYVPTYCSSSSATGLGGAQTSTLIVLARLFIQYLIHFYTYLMNNKTDELFFVDETVETVISYTLSLNKKTLLLTVYRWMAPRQIPSPSEERAGQTATTLCFGVTAIGSCFGSSTTTISSRSERSAFPRAPPRCYPTQAAKAPVRC